MLIQASEKAAGIFGPCFKVSKGGTYGMSPWIGEVARWGLEQPRCLGGAAIHLVSGLLPDHPLRRHFLSAQQLGSFRPRDWDADLHRRHFLLGRVRAGAEATGRRRAPCLWRVPSGSRPGRLVDRCRAAHRQAITSSYDTSVLKSFVQGSSCRWGCWFGDGVAGGGGRAPPVDDVRTIAVRYDQTGVRYREFREALALHSEDVWSDWPVRGS